MVDKTLVKTILKLALDTEQIKPEEVMAVLQRKAQGKTEDKNTETVDAQLIDSENPTIDDSNNDEGRVLESAFKELDVEDAIKEIKENKKYDSTEAASGVLLGPSNNNTVQKSASIWSRFASDYKVADLKRIKFKRAR